MDLNQIIFKYFVYFPVGYLKGMNIPFYVKRFKQSQYFSKEKSLGIQLSKLKSLLRYAREHVLYYKNTLMDGFEDRIASVADIRSIPFTTKKQIQENHDLFISDEKFLFLTKRATAGSTSEPFIIWKTKEAMAEELAATWRAYSWAGVDIGDRQGRFWGVPITLSDRVKARAIDFLTNRKRCSAFSFNQANMKYYTKVLSSFKPTYFYGYVSMLTEYARYFERNNMLPPFHLKCIVTTSEVLTPSDRNIIELIFNARVFDEYGCGELGSVAHECEEGSLHIMAENMIVEIMQDDEPCEPGMVGELVITELNNRAMPLIRYRTGDLASFSDKLCRCGRHLPVINNLSGRCWDMIKHKNGKLFHPAFFLYIFEEAKNRNLGIGQYKIIQLGYEQFKIHIIPESDYGPRTEEFVRSQIQKRFDKGAIVEFEIVDSIAREPSGKMCQTVGMKKGHQDHL